MSTLAMRLQRTPSTFVPEFRLVAECTLRPTVDREQWHQHVLELAQRVADWSAVQGLVRRHQVFSLVYEVLRDLAGQVRVPHEVLETLAASAKRSRLDGLLRLAEARRIAELFQRAAIPVLQIKGAPLSQRLYGDALLRHSMDIDVLVPADALADAMHLLQRLGYEQDEQQHGLHSRWQRYAEHHCILHNRVKVLLELHWRLGNFSEARTNRMVAQSLPDTTTGLSVLPLTSELVYLVMHGTSHYWCRLKWLSDIKQALLQLSPASWDEFAEECAVCGAQAAAEVTSSLLAAVFDTPSAQLPCDSSQQQRHVRSIGYALYRMHAPIELSHGMRSALDRTLYRLDCATAYDKLASALRVVRRLAVRHP